MSVVSVDRVWRAISDAHAFGTWFGVEFDGPFYVGLGVCSHNEDATETAEFSDVTLTSPLPPATPGTATPWARRCTSPRDVG